MNWKMILLDLRREYAPLAKIARDIGVSPKTLQGIARYGVSDVYYTMGAKLIELHSKHVKG